ncbi:MAG: DUF3501 family protein [Polyangiaceae bacterium]|nr:DUF3501 family protein [Polyangiaceae bacterium]
MRPIERNEVLPIGEYEPIRPRFRARVIEAKKNRVFTLSDIMYVAFENRDSVLLQIQEMLRSERITAEDGILHEIETYNELIPGPGQLSMTLYITIADKDRRESTLRSLAGLEGKVAIEIDGARFFAKGEDRSVEGIERTTALHYFKIDVSPEKQAAVRTGNAKAFVVVDHPAYPLRTELPPNVVRSIASDFDAS